MAQLVILHGGAGPGALDGPWRAAGVGTLDAAQI